MRETSGERLKYHLRRVRAASRGGLIPPEIVGDAFYVALAALAADSRVQTILEIGASSGAGSTEALIEGARRNPATPVIHAIEVSPPRYRALVQRHSAVKCLRCHNVSSIALDRFPDEQQVREFYETGASRLNTVPLSVVLDWLRADRETIEKHGLSENGIRTIKERESIGTFDMVLIDGSEFSGAAELEDVYGARFLLLDDIMTFKNFDNYARLCRDPAYALIEKDENLRNGYAVFARTRAD